MVDILNQSISLIGYGVSNKALCEYLMKRGITPKVRTPDKIDLPDIENIYGENYLNAEEKIVVRSPSVRPDRIKTDGRVTTEVEIALSLTKARKIGVTGSDGKSTVSTLISKILCADKKDASVCGNIGIPIINTVETSLENSYCVCELSSFQLFDFCPALDSCVITNITENHLDWHKSMSEYENAKANILKNSKRIVLPYSLKHLVNEDKENIIVCENDEQVKSVKNAHTVSYFGGYIRFDGKKQISLANIKLKGKFNLENIAFSYGALYGIVDNASVKKVIDTFGGIDHRMKFVGKVGGVSFFDSSVDSTPSRTAKTLSAFDKENTVLILGGYDKNLTYDILFPETENLKAVVICGDNKEKIYSAINGNNTPVYFANGFENCVKLAFFVSHGRGNVLLSPASASFDMFENYVKRAEKFIETVKEIKNERDKKDS